MKTLKTQTIAEFVKSRNFVEINKLVSTNVNGYPFVTFIDSNNKAENIYFSKSSSDDVSEGDNVQDFIANCVIVETVNAAGETRLKLSKNSNRISLASLLG